MTFYLLKKYVNIALKSNKQINLEQTNFLELSSLRTYQDPDPELTVYV
jgi:hypothetical protein